MIDYYYLKITFHGGWDRLGRDEGVCGGEGPLPRRAGRLYPEAVAAGLSQPLHPVGVARTAVDCHEPGGTGRERGRAWFIFPRRYRLLVYDEM